MYPHIINETHLSVDSFAVPIYQTTSSLGMYSYPILNRLRPPRKDLYARIITANEENRWRLMYSFVIDFVWSGSTTLFPHQGLMVAFSCPGNVMNNTFIIMSTSELIPLDIPHTITPILYEDEETFWTSFAQANPDYMQYLLDYSPEYVVAYDVGGLTFVIPPTP
jgi:hypothetical protein